MLFDSLPYIFCVQPEFLSIFIALFCLFIFFSDKYFSFFPKIKQELLICGNFTRKGKATSILLKVLNGSNTQPLNSRAIIDDMLLYSTLVGINCTNLDVKMFIRTENVRWIQMSDAQKKAIGKCCSRFWSVLFK